MQTMTFPVAIMAALALYVGINRLILFRISRKNPENFFFALLCLMVAFYDGFSYMLYNSSSIADGLIWQRHQIVTVSLVTIMLFLFIGEIVHQKPRLLTKIYYSSIVVLSVALLLDTPLVLDPVNFIQRRMNGLGGTLVFQEARPGPLLHFLFLIILCGMIYNLWRILRNVLLEKKKELYPLLLALPLFFISSTLDMLTGAGIINGVYTLEYSFFALLFAMDYIMGHRYNKVFLELENVNERLENQVANRTQKIQRMIDSIYDLNHELENKNKILAELAERDSMTRLYNHATLINRFEEVWNLAKRKKFSVSYIMMDIDHFKNLNDTYGHPVGDTIIKKVAEALTSQSRGYDVKGRFEEKRVPKNGGDYRITGRYGGDEFGIVLPYCDENETNLIAMRILERIRNIRIEVLPEIRINMSLGAVYWRPEMKCESAADLVHMADQALYEAKQQGRNRAVVVAFEEGNRSVNS